MRTLINVCCIVFLGYFAVARDQTIEFEPSYISSGEKFYLYAVDDDGMRKVAESDDGTGLIINFTDTVPNKWYTCALVSVDRYGSSFTNTVSWRDIVPPKPPGQFRPAS